MNKRASGAANGFRPSRAAATAGLAISKGAVFKPSNTNNTDSAAFAKSMREELVEYENVRDSDINAERLKSNERTQAKLLARKRKGTKPTANSDQARGDTPEKEDHDEIIKSLKDKLVASEQVRDHALNVARRESNRRTNEKLARREESRKLNLSS
jgi:hypothetical protein